MYRNIQRPNFIPMTTLPPFKFQSNDLTWFWKIIFTPGRPPWRITNLWPRGHFRRWHLLSFWITCLSPKATSWSAQTHMVGKRCETHTWLTRIDSGRVGLLSTSFTELSQGALKSYNTFKRFSFFRKHKIMVKKAMRYISNRTSCVTFLPGTSSSLNYVTIAPGPKRFLECFC